MDVKEAVGTRRACRSFVPVKITRDPVEDFAGAAGLAPTCFNNRPCRPVFVYNPHALEKSSGALLEGNRRARDSSLICAALSRKENDCILQSREFFLFDVGMAMAFMIPRAAVTGPDR